MSRIKFRLEILEGGYLLFQILEIDELFKDPKYLYEATNGVKIKVNTAYGIDVDLYGNVAILYVHGTRKGEDKYPTIKRFHNPSIQKTRILEAIKEWIDSIENCKDGKNNSNIYEY